MIPGMNDAVIVVMVLPAREARLAAGTARVRAGSVPHAAMQPRLEELMYPENENDEPTVELPVARL